MNDIKQEVVEIESKGSGKKNKKMTHQQIGAIDKAVLLLQKIMQQRIILKNHSIVASSSLPKHKQKKHDLLVADWIVKVRNSEEELDESYEKFNSSQKLGFLTRSREL